MNSESFIQSSSFLASVTAGTLIIYVLPPSPKRSSYTSRVGVKPPIPSPVPGTLSATCPVTAVPGAGTQESTSPVPGTLNATCPVAAGPGAGTQESTSPTGHRASVRNIGHSRSRD